MTYPPGRMSARLAGWILLLAAVAVIGLLAAGVGNLVGWWYLP